MRRCSVVLSVLLAAAGAVFAASPAHAHPVCVVAWTEGTVMPHVDAGATCASYPYGVMCHFEHTWVDPEAHVYVVACVPRVI